MCALFVVSCHVSVRYRLHLYVLLLCLASLVSPHKLLFAFFINDGHDDDHATYIRLVLATVVRPCHGRR